MDRRWSWAALAVAITAACGPGGRLVALDLDSDGISDVWAATYGVTNMAPSADPDGDGQDNLFESMAGTHPLDPLSRFGAVAGGEPPGSQTNVVVSWWGVLGKRYEVTASHDLLNWETFDGPFLGAEATLSVSDTVFYAPEGMQMMASGEMSERDSLIASLDPQPSWYPRSAATNLTDRSALYNFQFVCVSVFDNGLCSMTLFDGEDQFRILSNLPIGRLPGTQIWQDRPSGWGAFFLDHRDSWDGYAITYQIAPDDKDVAKLLKAKRADYVSAPFDRWEMYAEPRGWVLQFFEWMHDYYDANREYFAATEAAVRDGTYDAFLMATAPALASLEGGGVMAMEGTTDETRRFYRVHTLPSLDGDEDGLDAYEEGLLGTQDTARDSDGDNMPDPYEFVFGLNPLSDDRSADRDNDGVANGEDARPNDPNVGRLAVVISNPAGGQLVP